MQLNQLPVRRSGWTGPRNAVTVLLLGMSQIFFQAKVVPGLLILIAFVIADWRMALLVLLGAASNTVAGVLLRFPPSTVRTGHHGFCGALVGAAAFAALGGGWLGVVATVIGGLLCGPITWLLVKAFSSAPLKALQLPYLTAPFCIVASLMFFATSGHHVAREPVVLNESLTSLFFRSILSNVSQVLVSIALAAVFLKGSWQPWVMAIAGTLLVGVVRIPIQDWDGVYTWPFVLTTWILLSVGHFIPGIKRS